MKAVVQDRYGSVEVLRLADIAIPTPGDNEVLVRVQAAGVDAGVWHLMSGHPYLMRLFGVGFRGPKVPVRGRDMAGRVSAVGASVTRFQVGDEVFGTTLGGSFAEYAVSAETRLCRKPENLSFEEAAAVPTSACAALHGLRDVGKVRPGQRVLITGAGGGVGTFAVQLAKAFGADVTGVCSTSKVDLVLSLGADRVIDRTLEDFTESAESFDLILDTAGNYPLGRLRRVLKPGGTLVVVGGEGGGKILGGVDRQLRALLLSPLTRHRLRGLISSERAEDLEDLRQLIQAGKVGPVVEQAYPLHDAGKAVERLHTGTSAGKLVIAAGAILGGDEL